MYPMMPHMTVSSALVLSHLLPHALGPARLDHLPGPPERQRVRRHVLRHDRARPDHGPAPDRDRRHQGHVAADEGDRKSTRLNSSHGYISYAVFCLKKKKKQRKVHSVERLT